MIKRGVLGVFVLFGLALIASVMIMGIVSAGFGIVFPSASVKDADSFYSTAEYWLNVSVNATVMGSGAPILVRANLTKINSTACGNGYINLTLRANGLWEGNCSVSSFFTNTSQVTPILGNISFVGTESDGTNTSSSDMLFILMHNLGVPSMQDPANCSRFGTKTTNMTTITDFARVRFIVQVQVNFTCQTHGIYNGTNPGVFEDVGLMNLTSVNMTQSDIGDKLAALKDAINVTIGSPRTFEPSRIYVNSATFAALNSPGNVTLYNLPFTSKPNVLNDSGYALQGVNWYPGGYSSAKGVNIGNLTFDVLGFSGYNATDSVKPLLTINTPAAGINVSASTTNIVFSALVNGTGTEPSYITITNISGGTIYVYNGSIGGANTANCVNMSGTDRETWNCTVVFPVSGLSNGTNTVTVTAYDFGGIAGNVNSSSRAFTVDRTGPVLTVYSPGVLSYTNSSSVLFNISASDASTAVSTCWGYVNGTAFVMSSSGGGYFNYTNGSLAERVWTVNNFTCNDSLNNIGNTSSYTFVVDTSAPSLNVTLGTPTSSGVDVAFTSNDSIASIRLSYGTITALGSSSLSSVANVTSGSVSLSGLSASMLYYVNVTAYDRAGNSVTNGTFNFTTAAAATTGGENPSSGGGGSYGTYIVQGFQLEKGYTKEFAKNGAIKFNIQNESHSLKVNNITNDRVTITLASTPQTATLVVGEQKKFDLTGDGVYDLSVKLNRISINNIASLTVQTISEAIAPVTPAPPAKKGIAAAIPETLKKSSTWIWVLAIIGIIAVVAALYFITKSYMKFRRIH